jgi:hypothetical protein
LTSINRFGRVYPYVKTVAGELEGKRSLGIPRRRMEKILKGILGKQGGKVWTGFIWLMIGTSDRLLGTQ